MAEARECCPTMTNEEHSLVCELRSAVNAVSKRVNVREHSSGCMSHFFVEGQQVVKPNIMGLAYPWDRAPMLMREDRTSVDRTFENETRLH